MTDESHALTWDSSEPWPRLPEAPDGWSWVPPQWEMGPRYICWTMLCRNAGEEPHAFFLLTIERGVFEMPAKRRNDIMEQRASIAVMNAIRYEVESAIREVESAK